MCPLHFSYLVDRLRDGQKRADRRAGGITAMLYNINRDPEKDPNGLDWQDFYTEWKEDPGEQTEEEMLATMMSFTKMTEKLPPS